MWNVVHLLSHLPGFEQYRFSKVSGLGHYFHAGVLGAKTSELDRISRIHQS